MESELRGGCVCGRVRYVVGRDSRFLPYACHCTDCQSRSGSAFSENMLVARRSLRIEGALECGTYSLPGRACASTYGCGQCKVQIFTESATRPGLASVRCGTLDRSSHIEPTAHFWVSSKQLWLQLPEGATALAQQPATTAEWLKLVGRG